MPRLPGTALLFAAGIALAACSDAPDETRSSTVDTNPQIDQDPTPQTGTGGEQQPATPEGTVTDAPAAGESPAR